MICLTMQLTSLALYQIKKKSIKSGPKKAYTNIQNLKVLSILTPYLVSISQINFQDT